MGKRGRKPLKSDSNTRLEKSRESARQCRHRKKLRYEYLEELVNDREKAIAQLQQELERLRSICQQIDQRGLNNDIHQELKQWNEDPDIINFNQ
jgi:vacuolar-type H+-ATPase subunit E/Vma4